jgi:hypothetical protein
MNGLLAIMGSHDKREIDETGSSGGLIRRET